MSSKQDIMKIMGVISAAYPNFTPSEQTVEVYWQILSDIPADELKAATLHCISESGRKFAPSVGELRGAVGELRSLTDGIPLPADAWREASDSSGKGKPWSHPLVEKAAQAAGGWYNLSHSENVAADRARFLQFYESYVVRARNDASMLPDVRHYIESQILPALPEPEFDSYRTPDGEEHFE
jgi:hypothetical protein